jgi:hypothetical protein
MRSAKKRQLGGTRFICVRPGYWISHDRRLAIVEMMAGRVEHQWILFWTKIGLGLPHKGLSIDNPALDTAEFWGASEICVHFTWGELEKDVATALRIGPPPP